MELNSVGEQTPLTHPSEQERDQVGLVSRRRFSCCSPTADCRRLAFASVILIGGAVAFVTFIALAALRPDSGANSSDIPFFLNDD